MKKLGIILVCASLFNITFANRTGQKVFSRSFMYTRPGYYHLSMIQHLWHNIVLDKKGTAAAQLIGFFQRSISMEKTKKYFLPNCNTCMLVSGDDVLQDKCKRDIRAEWIGLPSDFRGEFTINPKQTQGGVYLDFNVELGKVLDLDFFQHSWLSCALAFNHVKNDLGFTQLDCACDIINAFNQCNWCFGKLPANELTLNKLGEVRFTLGRTYLAQTPYEVSYWSFLTIPTAGVSSSEFLFSPVVGPNGHVGLGGGASIQFLLNTNPEKCVWTFFVSLETVLLIKNTQCRTYDLKCKPFSRFLPMVRIDGTPGETIPGVNVLTLETTVRPYNLVDFSAGWRYRSGNIEAELGYNIWGHGEEHLRLTRCFPCNEFGIAGVGTRNPNDPIPLQKPATSSKSTIEQVAVASNSVNAQGNDIDNQGNEIFVAIKESDLDFDSAAGGSALDHKIHVALGYVTEKSFVGLGGFLNFPQKNSSLRLWGIWAKAGTTF